MKTVKNIIGWFFVLVALGVMVFTVFSVRALDNTDRTLFGYSAFIVTSDSMKETDFEAGDVIFVKEVDPDSLTEGDIIAYRSTAIDNYGKIVTHKIRARTTTDDGAMGFTTYGTSNAMDDEGVVSYGNVVGKYVLSIPKLGKAAQFVRTEQGYIFCIFIPFALIIGIETVNTIHSYRVSSGQYEDVEERKKHGDDDDDEGGYITIYL